MSRPLDPTLKDLSPDHLELWWRYQVVRTGVDFAAAACFVLGSTFFFFSSTDRAALWLFLFGSILFGVKPTIDVVRSIHLGRLPHPSQGSLGSDSSSGSDGSSGSPAHAR